MTALILNQQKNCSVKTNKYANVKSTHFPHDTTFVAYIFKQVQHHTKVDN